MTLTRLWYTAFGGAYFVLRKKGKELIYIDKLTEMK
jgi:hypothetical protein